MGLLMRTPREIILGAIANVASRVSREHIDNAVDTFLATFPADDLDARVALFAEDAIMDDPVGVRTASNRDELQTFFSNVAFSIIFTPQRRIVSGDEAILVSTLTIENGSGHLELDTVTHFRFNGAGLIESLRIFFDDSCLHKPSRDRREPMKS
jgi:steroid delta-isomerase